MFSIELFVIHDRGRVITFYVLFKRYMDNGKPTETAERFLELLKPLAESAQILYPDWRMRIYHNVTENDTEVLHIYSYATEVTFISVGSQYLL